MTKVIHCRASISKNCRGEWREEPEDEGDSTRRGDSVVCFACYILIDPYMRMNQPDIPAEADAAIARYRQAHDMPERGRESRDYWKRRFDECAARETEREAEVERLREALRPFVANRYQPFKHTALVFVTPEDFEVAVAALSDNAEAGKRA